jgi:hypothetical protein
MEVENIANGTTTGSHHYVQQERGLNIKGENSS